MRTGNSFLLIFLAAIFCGCVSPQKTKLQRFEFQQPQMGVPFRIVLYAPDANSAEIAANAAFSRISELNNRLSDYDYDSELSALSRTSGSGKKIQVSDDLWAVLVQSQKLAEQSGGAFDITVGPSVALWRKARREHKFLNENRLAEARRSTGWKNLKLDPKNHTAELVVPKMRLDLGAIAKGFAVDEAMKVLHKNGIHNALVSGGGDMAFSEPPPGKKGWRIELSSLDVTNSPATEKEILLLKNAALATSGDIFQYVEFNGKRYSHIVDPRTGIGLTDHSLVNVIAKNCATADSLSTAISVLGPRDGLKLLSHYPGVGARIIRKPGDRMEIIETPEFKRHVRRESVEENPGKSSENRPKNPA